MILTRVLVAVAATTIALGLPAGTRLPGGEPERHTNVTLAAPDKTQPTLHTPEASRSTPISIRIPHLDVVADVHPVGIEPNAEMEVPRDIRDVGWYTPTAPGTFDYGTTVLVGHRDGRNDPNGVFRQLERLEPGRGIRVLDSAGMSHLFRVQSVALLPDEAFPELAPHLFRSTGAARLVLITCGGTYVRDQGGYQSTVVVIATPE